jgi:hypothetical protein
MPEPKKARPSYTQVNRNLCNYPLARDGHTRARWRRSKKTGRMLCELPGDDRIRLRLAADADRRLMRLPTGFDMALLLALLRAAHLAKAAAAEFASVAAIIRDMGLEPGHRHRRAVLDALALWSALGVIHDAWHLPQQGRGRLVLPPPICGIDKSPGRLRVRLSDQWCDLAARYFVRVPRNIPIRAPVQNLILDPGAHGRVTQRKRRRGLCRIIGVNHRTRNSVLASTIAAASRWFEAQGGSLQDVSEGEYVVFIVHDPKHRRTRTPRKQSKREASAPPAIRRPKTATPPAAAKAPAATPVDATDDSGRRYTMWRLPTGEYVDTPPRRVSASDAMMSAMMDVLHEK